MLENVSSQEYKQQVNANPELYSFVGRFNEIMGEVSPQYNKIRDEIEDLVQKIKEMAAAHQMGETLDGSKYLETFQKERALAEAHQTNQNLDAQVHVEYLCYLKNVVPELRSEVIPALEKHLLLINEACAEYESHTEKITSVLSELSQLEAEVLRKTIKLDKLEELMETKSMEAEDANILNVKEAKTIENMKASIEAAKLSLEKINQQKAELNNSLLERTEKKNEERAKVFATFTQAEEEVARISSEAIEKSFPSEGEVKKQHAAIVNSMFDIGKFPDPNLMLSINHVIDREIKSFVSHIFKTAKMEEYIAVYRERTKFKEPGQVFRELVIKVLKGESDPKVEEFKASSIKFFSAKHISNKQGAISRLIEAFPHLSEREIAVYADEYLKLKRETFANILEQRKYKGVKIDSKKLTHLSMSALICCVHT